MTTEEILKIINAYKEGKTIECRLKVDLDMHKNPFYDWDTVPSNADYNWNFAMYEYRIKEDPKLRPYKSAEEFFQAIKEHGPYYIPKDLKNKEYMLPINVLNNGFRTYHGSYLQYEEFAQLCKWQDGTPCGILENN